MEYLKNPKCSYFIPLLSLRRNWASRYDRIFISGKVLWNRLFFLYNYDTPRPIILVTHKLPVYAITPWISVFYSGDEIFFPACSQSIQIKPWMFPCVFFFNSSSLIFFFSSFLCYRFLSNWRFERSGKVSLEAAAHLRSAVFSLRFPSFWLSPCRFPPELPSVGATAVLSRCWSSQWIFERCLQF